jgi:hypothetical protein
VYLIRAADFVEGYEIDFVQGVRNSGLPCMPTPQATSASLDGVNSGLWTVRKGLWVKATCDFSPVSAVALKLIGLCKDLSSRASRFPQSRPVRLR